MIKDVAKHSLGETADRRGKRKPLTRRDADAEVEAIARWLRKRARRVERDERRITHRQLRTILGRQGFEMRDPKNNSIAVCRRVERRKGVFLKKITEYERLCSITYRGDTQLVALRDARTVRQVASWMNSTDSTRGRSTGATTRSTCGSTTTAASSRSSRRSDVPLRPSTSGGGPATGVARSEPPRRPAAAAVASAGTASKANGMPERAPLGASAGVAAPLRAPAPTPSRTPPSTRSDGTLRCALHVASATRGRRGLTRRGRRPS
jgi:hypothetical protein